MKSKIIIIFVLLIAIAGGVVTISKLSETFANELPALPLEETSETSSSNQLKEVTSNNQNEISNINIEENIDSNQTNSVEIVVDEIKTTNDSKNNNNNSNDSSSIIQETTDKEDDVRIDAEGNIILPKVKFTNSNN